MIYIHNYKQASGTMPEIGKENKKDDCAFIDSKYRKAPEYQRATGLMPKNWKYVSNIDPIFIFEPRGDVKQRFKGRYVKDVELEINHIILEVPTKKKRWGHD